MWSDTVADMLTRIRNAVAGRKREVKMPNSQLKAGIARVLQEEGYIDGFDTIEDTKQGVLRLRLRYGPRGENIIHSLQRVSRPGCRVYRGVGGFPKVLDGLGVSIVSTNRGVLSDRRCREQSVGGEVLCTVY